MKGPVKEDNVAGHRKKRKKKSTLMCLTQIHVSFIPLKTSFIHLKGLKITSDFSPSLIL